MCHAGLRVALSKNLLYVQSLAIIITLLKNFISLIEVQKT